MPHIKTTALAVTLLLCCAVSSFAASAVEFYVDLLEKGISQYNAAEYSQAATLLRTAAFGLLDATDRYQTAQIYRTIAADKLQDGTATREAARRVLAAERVQKTYATLSLPASVRSSFETVARKILAPSEMAMLKSAPSQQPPQPQTSTSTPPATSTKPAPQENKPKTTPPQTQAQPQQNQAKAEPKPEPKKPEPKKPEPQKPEPPKPEPAKVDPSKPEPAKPEPKPEQKPAQTKPAPVTPAPAPAPPPATTQPPRDVAQQLASADRALNTGNLTEARRIYRQLLDATLTHEQAIRVAEGLYRARDFAYVLRAFERVGTLRRGEEPYRFYLAVAYYETGRFAAAKKELAAALNFIEVTPDVARYREKIESAVD